MGKLNESVRESVSSLQRVFSNPALRRLNIAYAVSTMGDWAYAVVISIYAFQHGGPTVLGIYGVLRYLSMATVGPFMSQFGDMFPRKRVMVTADLVRCLLVGSAAAIVALGGSDIAVYALGIATAIVSTAFRPAQASLLPLLARDPAELTAANAAASTIESVGFFAGPAIAALLLAVANQQTVIALDAASFVWSASFLAGVWVKPVPPEPGEEKKASRLVEATRGFRTLLGNRDLRLLTVLFVGQTLIAGASLVFNVDIALRLLHMGRPGVGVLEAVIGVGGITGGFIALSLAYRRRPSFDFGIGVVLWSAPLLLVAAWPSLPSAMVMVALIGIGNSLVDINAFTVLQRVAPTAVMSRVFGAVESLLIGGMGLGALLMPLFITTIGLRAGLLIFGATVSLAALSGLVRLRRIDERIGAPKGLALVRSNEILAPLSEAVQEELARSLIEVSVPAGQDVVTEGAPGDRFYLIESGSAEVMKGGAEVGVLGPGEGFGEIALLRDVPRQATVRAVEDLQLFALEREIFLEAVTGHSESNRLANTVVSRFLGS